MRKGEIFENYIKIAKEQEAKKALEENPRIDWQDSEKLYNISPESYIKYKRNIMEAAHPKPAVVAPSYDKLQGLVENKNEQQDITINILNKIPDGNNTNFKYAHQQLTLNLVSIANDLDNRNETQLAKLADNCLTQMTKVAIEPITMTIIATVAVLGLIYANQHLSNANEGFERNHEKLINEVNDLLKSNSGWGVGYDLSDQVKEDMTAFINHLESFKNVYDKIVPIMNSIEKPKDAKQLKEIANRPQTNKVLEAKDILKKEFDNMYPFLETVEKNFKSNEYKERVITHKGVITNVIDKMQFLHGGHGLILDDFDDVVAAIGPYKQSVKDIMNIFNKAKSFEQDAFAKIQAAQSKELNEFPLTPSMPVMQQQQLDKDISDLVK